jgi:hypothetical protein
MEATDLTERTHDPAGRVRCRTLSPVGDPLTGGDRYGTYDIDGELRREGRRPLRVPA